MNNTSYYLKAALALAEIRRGFCAPNPCVGAILVKNAQIIATGYHLASGYDHAEVDAINKGDISLAQGATLYVTLQPCCHTTKKTPPCTDLIINSGIVKVIYGFRDPNPAVNTHTDKILQHAGIECIQYPLPAIDNFYASYVYWWKHKRPFTTAKLAMSLDGKIAGTNGKRIQLTGDATQQFTHQQRKQTDAILTTAKTVCLDNPLLNSRLNDGIHKKPLYILDTHLNIPASAKIFNSAESITIFHDANLGEKHQQRLQQHDLRFVPIKSDKNGLNLVDVLEQIGLDGKIDLWIEAGGHSFQTFIKNDLLQRAFIYVAPLWLGENTQTAFTFQNPLKGAIPINTKNLGRDTCFEFKWSDKKAYNAS
ncbi:MAG: bifunctional diaminohydroxyphosphoribosylaminopyrimidine deaminase/5-amino-6-(5-phosphoribosylamino)uracil reductase RibD [Candidatus Aquirickettsiella sp.]